MMRSHSEKGVAGWIVLVVLAAIIGSGLVFYGYINGLRSESVKREAQLSAQYQSNQNYLSTYISGFYEQIGVANLKSEKMDQILSDAVKGRYEKSGGFSQGGGFFSAILEAYPNLAGLNIFDKIVEYISGQRAGYRDIQDKLLDMLRSYYTWRQDGFVQSFIVSSVIGVPTDRLEARLSDGALHGAAARDKMYQIVLASQAQEAYKTGTMDPLAVPKK